MSKEILKAILQLLAIVAKEDDVTADEKASIENFLSDNLPDSELKKYLEEFDQLIWKKCLKEASENPEIIQMKKSLEELHELAMDLIEEITR